MNGIEAAFTAMAWIVIMIGVACWLAGRGDDDG